MPDRAYLAKHPYFGADAGLWSTLVPTVACIHGEYLRSTPSREAADEMLEALNCAWKLIEQINEFGRCVDHQTWEIAYDKVQAARAKAEGRT